MCQVTVYIAVQTNKSNEQSIRSNLMGQSRGSQLQQEWGRIDSSQHDPFRFTSDFFYWLLSKKGSNIERGGHSIEIYDVSAVALFSERAIYNTNSEGDGLLDGSVSALSALSLNENIQNVGVVLKIENYNFDFRFNHKSEVNFHETRTYKVTYNDQGIENGIINYEAENVDFIIMLVTAVLPILIEEYRADLNWTPETHQRQQKMWAINVITKLMQHSSVTLEEISENIATEINENIV